MISQKYKRSQIVGIRKLNMLRTFQDVLAKYFKRNRESLLSHNIVHEMNGVVLVNTSIAIFNFNGTMIDEVIAYCTKQGYPPDKIIFISSYDIEVVDAPNMNMKMEGDSSISIIKEDGKIVVRVCIGEWVALKETEI